MPGSSLVPDLSDTLRQRFVFVYGTLRRSGSNDITRLRPLPRWVGPATVRGVMYDLGRYPGVRLGGAAHIQGEVYAICPALEQQLDGIEEVWPHPTGEYSKRLILVTVPQAPDSTLNLACAAKAVTLPCLVYEINPSRVVGRAIVDGGDWLQRSTHN